MEGLGRIARLLPLSGWNQTFQRLAFHSHGNTAVRVSRFSLRFQDHELASRPAKNLSVELHHAVASMDITRASQWTRRVDLRDYGVFCDDFDWDLLL
jgi:hypothetical protein